MPRRKRHTVVCARVWVVVSEYHCAKRHTVVCARGLGGGKWAPLRKRHTVVCAGVWGVVSEYRRAKRHTVVCARVWEVVSGHHRANVTPWCAHAFGG